MNENLTEMVFILDRSGSMAGLEDDTIGGFNAMLKKQKEEEGQALLSVVLFANESAVLYDRVDIQKAEPMTGRQYRVGGGTALLDAIGGAIHHIGSIHLYARDEDCPGKTVFVITTDGMENSSRFYSYDRVQEMVKRQHERYGWEFLFLGADLDAVAAAGRFGIRADRAVRYQKDGVGIETNFRVLDCSIRELRRGRGIRSDWTEEIAEDYRRRGK